MPYIVPSDKNQVWVQLAALYDNLAQGQPTATPVAFNSLLAADAIRTKDCKINQRVENVLRDDTRSDFRTPIDTYPGNAEAEFEIEGCLSPSGTPGVAPDWGPGILDYIFGPPTVDPGVSVLYSPPLDLMSVDTALVLLQAYGPDRANYLVNGFIESATFSFVNGERSMVKVSGKGAMGGEIGFATANTQVSGTTITVPTTHYLEALRRWVGNKIYFLDGVTVLPIDNGGAGYTLVSVAAFGGTTAVVSPAVALPNGGNLIRAFVPARTLASDVVVSGPAGVTIAVATNAAQNLRCKSCEITIDRVTSIRREAGFSGPSGAHFAEFAATVKLEMVADVFNAHLLDVARHLADLSVGAELAITFDAFQSIFTSTGRRLRVTMPRVVLLDEPDFSPNAGDAYTLGISGRLLTTSIINTTHEDSLQLKFL